MRREHYQRTRGEWTSIPSRRPVVRRIEHPRSESNRREAIEVSVSRGLATEAGEPQGPVLPPDLLVVGGYKALPQRLFDFRVLYRRTFFYQVGELRFYRQADSHRTLSKEYERRAEKLCEEGNPDAA